MSDFLKKCERYAELRAELDKREWEAQPLVDEAAALQKEILAEHPASGLGKSFKLASGCQMIFSDVMTVKALDKAAVTKWFTDRGLTDMLSVNHQSLNAFCKEEAANARPLPDGVEVGSFTKLSLRQ